MSLTSTLHEIADRAGWQVYPKSPPWRGSSTATRGDASFFLAGAQGHRRLGILAPRGSTAFTAFHGEYADYGE
jgi:hypothetical protein